MSTEKTIRRQAKAQLRDNWGVAAAAMAFVCAAALALRALSKIACVITGVYDESGNFDDDMYAVYMIINTVVTAAELFLSPLLSGLVKIFTNIAVRGKAEARDLLYYFSSKYRYFSTVAFNIKVAVPVLVLFLILNPEIFAKAVFGISPYSAGDFGTEAILPAAISALTVIIKLLIYFAFAHYPLIAYSMLEEPTVFLRVLPIYKFSFRRFGKTLKLAFGFIGWAALCFFVIPVIYVFPYAYTSACVSAKWLFELDFGRGVPC